MEATRKGPLIVLSGPSGAGKTTVLNMVLRERDDLFFSVSCTTRKRREGERDGVDYIFLSREEFERGVAGGRFIEWAEYAGNLYGTPLEPIERARNGGRAAILEIEVQGAAQVLEKYPEAALVYIWPGSFEELEQRLRGRKTDSEDTIKRRLEIAGEEYKAMDMYKYKIVNRSLEEACRAFLKIIDEERKLIGGINI